MLPAETIGRAVAELAEPVIFTGFRDDVEGGNNPGFLRWDIDEFRKIFGDESLPFRTGDNARTTVNIMKISCILLTCWVFLFFFLKERSLCIYDFFLIAGAPMGRKLSDGVHDDFSILGKNGIRGRSQVVLLRLQIYASVVQRQTGIFGVR